MRYIMKKIIEKSSVISILIGGVSGIIYLALPAAKITTNNPYIPGKAEYIFKGSQIAFGDLNFGIPICLLAFIGTMLLLTALILSSVQTISNKRSIILATAIIFVLSGIIMMFSPFSFQFNNKFETSSMHIGSILGGLFMLLGSALNFINWKATKVEKTA
ncbi:hypothetical protein LJC17_04555 [Acholeplasma sp. OttesenSCG-928-E16]|nr:hypothetical protein [Acholeplasma sp. OttesenSCG-928-E16]